MGGKFKFQLQDSDLEYLFWQCEKHMALSEKKPPLPGLGLPVYYLVIKYSGHVLGQKVFSVLLVLER